MQRLLKATFMAAFLLGANSAHAQQKLIISNWDGYMPKDLLANFTKETGIQAEASVHSSNEEIMGKVVASKGKGFDLIFVSTPFAEALRKLDIAADIDHSKIPNLSHLYPQVTQLPYDPGLKYSVPYSWGTTGLCYRSDLVKKEPTSWFDLLKPAEELKGKTTMVKTDRWLMGPALLALGYSINATDKNQIDEAKALLIETKKTLLAYDDTTFYSKLVSGEAHLVEAWDGWCNYGIAENPAIKYVIAKEGSDVWMDTMVVMASSENKEAAHAFINYVLRPEIHRWVVENVLYKVPNKTAMESLDPKLIAQYPNIGMSAEELLKFEITRDLGSAQKLWSKTVNEITTAN